MPELAAPRDGVRREGLAQRREVRVERPVPVLVRDLERDERQRVHHHEVAGRDPGVEGADPVDRREVERRDEHRVVQRPGPGRAPTTAAAARSSGSKSASWGEFFISTFTSIPAQTSNTSSRVGIAGQRGRGSRPRSCSARTPKPSTAASWWTTSAPSAVRWTSSSTPSAPWSRAAVNAASVFSTASRGAPRWPSTSGAGFRVRSPGRA